MSEPATPRPPLTPEQLTPALEPERFHFATTAELEGESGQLGAERALAAMRLGIRVRERWSGAFSRSIELPGPVDAERLTATLHEGILRIVLPRHRTLP